MIEQTFFEKLVDDWVIYLAVAVVSFILGYIAGAAGPRIGDENRGGNDEPKDDPKPTDPKLGG